MKKKYMVINFNKEDEFILDGYGEILGIFEQAYYDIVNDYKFEPVYEKNKISTENFDIIEFEDNSVIAVGRKNGLCNFNNEIITVDLVENDKEKYMDFRLFIDKNEKIFQEVFLQDFGLVNAFN